MASELRVDTLKDSSGNNSVGMAYVSGGSAKAWAKFDDSATLADSFNISSSVDVQTGQWRFAKTNSMVDTDYVVVGMGGYLIGSFNTGYNSNATETTANHTQSKYDSNFQDFGSGGYGMHNVHGDLA